MNSSRMRAKTDKAKTATKLLVALTGMASPAKAAEGDEPVFATSPACRSRSAASPSASMPWRPRRYGTPACGEVGDGVLRRGRGLVFSSGAFDGHVKLMLIRGTEIKPEPPVTPVGMGKSTRGVELAFVDHLDQRQAASWMRHAAAIPFIGGRRPGIGWPASLTRVRGSSVAL